MTTTATCAAPDCARPADTYLCQHCRSIARNALAALPGLLAELQVTASRQAQTSRRGTNRAKSSEAPIAFDWDAADMDWAVRNTVTTWARHVVEDRFTPAPEPLAGPTCEACFHPSCDAVRRRPALIRLATPPTQFAALCGWLAGQVDWLARRPEAAVFLDEITSIRPFATRAVDNREDRYAGPCTALVLAADLGSSDDGQLITLDTSRRVCAADLRARNGAATITCRACGAQYDAAERAGWIDQQSAEHVASAGQIAQVLTESGYPTKSSTIRKWGQRGRERMAAMQHAAGLGPVCTACPHASCETARRAREWWTYLELDVIAPCAYSVADRLPLYRVGDVYARVKAEAPADSERIGA